MKKNFGYLLVLGSSLFFISCNNTATDTSATKDTSNMAQNNETFDPDKTRSSIEDENRKFTEEFKRGDSTALTAHYTSDAFAMPPNSEPVKHADLASLWGGAIRMGIKD